MKSIINTLLLIAAIFIGLILTGVITEDQLLDMFGEVEEGETVQSYEEGEFKKAFDFIVGKVEVNDTSRTEFDRKIVLCEPGYVVHTTFAEMQYQVLTDSSTLYVNADKKEYYISPDLGITLTETSTQRNFYIEESNCIKKRNITPDNINSTKRKAEAAFRKAINNSPKIIQAHKEFQVRKQQLVQQFEDAGYTEVIPPSPTPNIENIQPHVNPPVLD